MKLKRRDKLQNTEHISKNLSNIELEIKNLLDELLIPLKKISIIHLIITNEICYK